MSSRDDDQQGFSVSVPIGAAVGAILLLGAATVAYMLLSGDQNGEGSSAAKSGRSAFRRFGLLSLVTLIENDATRKVVVAILKAIARRS